MAVVLTGMVAVPFAVIGGILTLWLTGTNISIPVYIGAIMLVGIAVNNGIIMVDYTNQLRQSGLDVMSATQQGAGRGVNRLRILAKTLV